MINGQPADHQREMPPVKRRVVPAPDDPLVSLMRLETELRQLARAAFVLGLRPLADRLTEVARAIKADATALDLQRKGKR